MRNSVVLMVMLYGILVSSCARKDISQITYLAPLLHTKAILITYPYFIPGPMTTDCQAVVFNATTVPIVTLNQDTLTPIDYYNITFRRNRLNIAPGTALNLKVQDQDCIAAASAVQPDSLEVVCPDELIGCLSERDSILTTWKRAEQAQWYAMVFQWQIQWLDSTTQEWEYSLFDTLLVTADTTYTFTSGKLWVKTNPNAIAKDWDATFYFIAGNGPKPIPGTPGNFSGDGTGFFVSLYLTKWYSLSPQWCFDKSPTDSLGTTGNPTHLDIIKRLLPKIGA